MDCWSHRRWGRWQTFGGWKPSVRWSRTRSSAEKVLALTDGGCDVVIETAGSISAFNLAYSLCARGGTAVAVGLPQATAEFSYLQSALVSEERRIVGSYMGSGDPAKDIPEILGLYRAGKLPFDRLKTRTIGFNEINEAFDDLAQGKTLRTILNPGS